MKKYLASKPVNSTKNSEKQKSVSVSTYNSSPTTPLIPELTAEPSCLQFICNVYNASNAIDVDAARLQMFIHSKTISDVKEAFDRKKLRKFDVSNLPPCKSELLQQFLRANYICTIWEQCSPENSNHISTSQ
ncbi:uncharacterized protein TNCT_165391 [Trichonephila clavata]|uniref:Uncharacterized protein n=1 Tax=Trichonephila clavata TaxID=2740835 RepID=A0A8X6LM15_TRICU|nr:uncharacterized protein TNCT_165391 [Trichonephila clavata]